MIIAKERVTEKSPNSIHFVHIVYPSRLDRKNTN